jgi:hypothetical protein
MLFSLTLVASCSIPIRSEWALERAVPWLELPIQFVWLLANFLFLILLFVFPNGRFVPRWTRLLGTAAIPAAALVDLSQETSKARLGLTALIWSLFWGVGLYAQIYRYRHVSGPVQRQQTKWVALAFGLLVLFLLLGTVIPLVVLDAASGWFLWVLPALPVGFVLFPASIAIAILRHHLYDIDRLLSRTLTYGLLTVVLGILYVSTVVILGQVLNPQGGDSALAVAASTLLGPVSKEGGAGATGGRGHPRSVQRDPRLTGKHRLAYRAGVWVTSSRPWPIPRAARSSTS